MEQDDQEYVRVRPPRKDAAIRTLYVQKDGMPGQDPPPAIIVTATADE